MSIIKLEDINLIFKIYKEKKIRDLIIPGSNKFNDYKNGTVHALKDFNFEIKDGERVSIIGHNGAGKSTFLKLVSGIYPPTSGNLTVNGRISSMFELATGFEMEQSGWDNIYLRGLMLGETPKEIKSKMKEIAEFSELGDFLNMPVKYYSSGMFVRLAFSISTAIKPDILLLDEVLSAGDAAFVDKAQKRMKEMMSKAKIIILVTHDMTSAQKICNRCIWLERGEIRMDGDPKKVVEAYTNSAKK